MGMSFWFVVVFGVTGVIAWAVDPVVGIVYTLTVLAIWYASCYLHPRRACWTCNGSGRHSGLLYGYANRACTSCAGSGRKLRLGARIFRFDMNSPR